MSRAAGRRPLAVSQQSSTEVTIFHEILPSFSVLEITCLWRQGLLRVQRTDSSRMSDDAYLNISYQQKKPRSKQDLGKTLCLRSLLLPPSARVAWTVHVLSNPRIGSPPLLFPYLA